MSDPDLASRRRLLRAAATTAARPWSAAARARGLRSPRRRRVDAKGAIATPPAAVVATNRMGFGPRPGDLAAFDALGATDPARLAAYVDQQLDPASIPDDELDARLAGAGYTTLGKSLAQLWADHHVDPADWYERIRPFEEVEKATLLRAIYSRRQLFEVMVGFWHDHFNVFGPEYHIAPVLAHYDRDVVRAHALGNFRELLEAVATSTAMLYYLDNYTSSNGGPNENWARELFELMTMGAEHYLGVRQQNQVPVDALGRPTGYVDADVYEATRAFTGWSVSNSDWEPAVGNTGLFLYRSEWHDRFQKHVLGTFLPADQAPLADGRDVLDALAEHPGTARHVCRKLCRRLVADDPPQPLVDAAAEVFLAAAGDADQIAQVVRTILLRPELLATWGEKVKRPFELVVSALRAGGADFTPRVGDDDTDTFFWLYDACGHALFRWPAPNGYPDDRDAWTSTTPRAMGWRFLAWLVEFDDQATAAYRLDVVAQTPPGVRSANELADFWIDRVLGRPLEAADRAEVVAFMAQGVNPGLDLPLTTDEEVADRLRSMVALLFMSPDFAVR